MSNGRAIAVLRCGVIGAICLTAQKVQSQEPNSHQGHAMPAESSTWVLMQDGVIFGMFNHQGGPRGDDEFTVPNWWMGMATRKTGNSQLTFTAMLSLEPATVGKEGYREIFQVGETLDGQPLIDRQHPHELFMQLSAIWRVPVSDRTGLTLAAAPVGEPALGPVAFMHRAAAAENPFAPLGHHIFDSSHVAFGVITAAADRGPFVLEGSLFNGREPDENRWDFDFGRLDSISARLWFKPTAAWEMQVSMGRVKEAEALEPGNIRRTTASAAWTGKNGSDLTALGIGYGRNDTDHGTRHAAFAEATRKKGSTAAFGRFELLQVETELLLNGSGEEVQFAADENPPVGAFTAGGVRDVLKWRGFEGGLGGQISLYAVPQSLKATHGRHPISFQLFFRLRPPAPMGRMWNMRMSQPLAGHRM